MSGRRRCGRPRDAAIDRRVLTAALELLASGGLTAITMDAVAARAGVSKPTLYRRWASKEELVIDALAARKPRLDVADSGNTRADLVDVVRAMLRPRLVAEDRVLSSVFAEVVARPQLRQLLWERHLEPRRRELRALLECGVARGEVRADLDLDLAVDALWGAVVSAARTAFLAQAAVDEQELAERLVATLWLGFGQ